MLAHALLAVTARAPRAELGRPEPFPAGAAEDIQPSAGNG